MDGIGTLAGILVTDPTVTEVIAGLALKPHGSMACVCSGMFVSCGIYDVCELGCHASGLQRSGVKSPPEPRELCENGCDDVTLSR